jgi:F-type H+-transporting ATPase subunit b|tara:strand:- start:811 stop:1341 length:531 start_codon:yes stop_codon:yes gene_type:complete
VFLKFKFKKNKEMDLITPGLGLVFWTAITFLCLLFILKKFAWKPILGAVSDREKSIKDALASAEEAKKEMQNLNASNEQLLKDARAERDALMKDARDIKDKMISDAKEEAKEVTAKLIDNALTSIEQEKQAALAELKNQVAELSIGIAETVIKKELASKDDQLKLVEEILKEVKLS